MKPLDLSRHVADIPRWVEARALLLAGACDVFGVSIEPELSAVVLDEDTTMFVIGAPPVSAIEEALQTNRVTEVIAGAEHAAWLGDTLRDWAMSRIIVHRLDHPERLPPVPDGVVRLLDAAALADYSFDPELAQEIVDNAESPIATTFVADQPVSFCYAGVIGETLWDIGVDTLEDHRGKGYAGLCVAHLIHHMHALRRAPVWQAVEENPASLRLAAKLGFEPLDELVLFERR